MPTHLNLPDAYYVRYLGGYFTNTGKITKYQKYLRSGTLHLLSKKSMETLEQYGVKTVIDLRQNYDVEANPDVFQNSSTVTYIHINMIGDGEVEAFMIKVKIPSIQYLECIYLGLKLVNSISKRFL